ncbi:MAG: sigma-70 family RNA polymerase sigma factor [Clostridiales bacterium]|nr:sigma-70 family RNA polymerase sigma factor [Clostridiales bacterium]
MTDKELEQIYNEGYRAVYWTAMSFLKNEADAEDVVQDSFVTLIRSYDTIKDKSKVLPWLKKTAANKCLDRIKLRKTDIMDEEFFDSVEAVPEDFLPDSIIESAEMRKIVMDIINNSLSEDIRMTLILFYFNEMSIKEIALAQEIPEGTVSRRLNSARNKIKKEVEKYEEDNNTKLFGMALPFLSRLFIKEAEQVPFRPMPASLSNLSASTKVPGHGTGKKLLTETVRKGTGIMKTKVLIGGAAAIVAVGTAVGIFIGVTGSRKDSKPGRDRSSREHRETEADPEDTIYEDIEAYTEPDDLIEETEVTEETEAVIPEDAIAFDMTGMDMSEIIENIHHMIIVEDGMTESEYMDRFYCTDDTILSDYESTDFYWIASDAYADIYLNQLHIYAVGNGTQINLAENSSAQINLAVRGEEEGRQFYSDLHDSLAEEYELVEECPSWGDVSIYVYSDGNREFQIQCLPGSRTEIILYLPLRSADGQ